jgi:hypothetical protein
MRQCTRGGIILLEEPENFLSPNSQEALVNILASEVLAKRLSVVMTTHSPAILKMLPVGAIPVLFRMGAGAQIAGSGTQKEMLRAIGLTRSKTYVMLVEDRAAREFCKIILQIAGYSSFSGVDVLDVGGVEGIIYLLKAIPDRGKFVAFVGLFDPDVRDKAEKIETDWSTGFLPVERNVEYTLRKHVDYNIASVAETLGAASDRVSVVHSLLVGSDDHDWLEEFAKGLGMNFDVVLSRLVENWYLDAGIRPNVDGFISQIHQWLAA